MSDGFEAEVYVQVGPVEMARRRFGDVRDFSDCSFAEPRKILVGKK